MVRARKDPPGAPNASSPQNPLRSVPTGRGYGQAQELQEQMAAVPMTSPAAPSAGSPDRSAGILDAAKQYTPPQVGLGNPTARPGEPVTAGLGQPMAVNTPPPADPDVIAIAQYLPTLERLAAKPNSSMAMRAFVMRLRSTLPPDFEFNR